MRMLFVTLLSASVFLLAGCGDDAKNNQLDTPNSTENSTNTDGNLTAQEFNFVVSRITGEIDEEFQLSASGEGAGTIQYESSDSSIAEVSDSGLLQLKAKGDVVITATIASDGSFQSASATLPVKVNRKKTTISMAIYEVSVSVFETLTHLPTVSREGAYYFHSSNPDVATVSTTGVVTAKGYGTTDITVQIPANRVFDSAATSYTVQVSRVDQDIQFSPLDQPLRVFVDRSIEVTAAALGDTQVYYRSLDEAVARVDENGQITAIDEGSTSIQAYTSETGQYNAAAIDMPIIVEDVLLNVKPSNNKLTFEWQTASMFDQYRVYKRPNDTEGFVEIYSSIDGVTFTAIVDPILDKSASFYFEACNNDYCYVSDTTAISAPGVFEHIIPIIKSDLPSTENRFAHAMDISDDGTRLIIGSPYEDEQRGVVYLYELVDAEWTLFRKIENVGYSDSEPGDLRGMGVAISGDGQTIAFSAPGNDISMNEYHDRECKVLSCPFPDFPIVDQGSVYYGEWAAYGNVKEVYNAYLPLGSQVKLNGDGSVLVFEKVEDDSSTHGRASIYSKVLTYYDEEELITELPSPIFDTSADGNMVAVVENHQASYSNLKVFKEDGTLGVSYSECFSQFYSGINMNHVGISESGSRLILVTDTRELLLYELEITDDERGNEYVTYNKTYTSDLNDYAVVNASISDDGTRILIADADQKVRILTESDSGWVVQDEIESPNLDLGDCFGCVLAKPNDGDVFVIGAPGEDSNSRDDLFDNGVTNNGAVYLF